MFWCKKSQISRNIDPILTQRSRIKTGKRGKHTSHVSQFIQILYLSSACLVTIAFALWWFEPQHIPKNFIGAARIFDVLLFLLVSFIIWHPIMMDILTWVISSHIKDIRKQKPLLGKKVAFITTYVPGSESIELLHKCLPAMVNAAYTHDTWLLDEGNDPQVKEICERYGVFHFSRKRREEFKDYSGKFTKTKGGNHNSWYVMHGNSYDYVAQIDTDFVPKKNFLTRTLGYFRDPQVAFVGTPQIYGNSNESIIAKGAAEQLYTFYGTVLKGLSSMNMTLLIGANHVIRVNALRSVNHYSAHITEDLLTGMKLHMLGWKSVYISEPLAVGEGPATWEAYFSQQMRWAYGCMDIFFRHSPRLFRFMGLRQSVYYFFLQQHYFSGVAMAISTLLLSLYFFFGIRTADVDLYKFVSLYSFVTLACWLTSVWLQCFNVEKSEEGQLLLAGKIISVAAWPVWFLAFLGVIFHRRLSYKVTPKGNGLHHEPLNLKIFIPHIIIGIISTGALISSFFTHRQNGGMVFWAFASSITMLSVPFIPSINKRLHWVIKKIKKINKRGHTVKKIGDFLTLFEVFPQKTLVNELVVIPQKNVVLDLMFLCFVFLSSVILYVTKLGFYSDDWAFLGNFQLSADKSLWGLIQVATTPNTLMRPVQNVYDALLFSLFGLNPLGYHLVNVVVFLGILLLFYAVLRKCSVPRIICLSLPLVFVLLPNYSTDKFWFASHQANLSVLFYLFSLYATLQIVTHKSRKRTIWRINSIVGMILSILSYETILPLFVINLMVLLAPKKLLLYSYARISHAQVFSIVLSVALGYLVFFKAVTTQRLGGHIELDYVIQLFSQAFKVNYIEWGLKLPYIWGSVLGEYHSSSYLIGILILFIVIYNYLYSTTSKQEQPFPSIRFFRNSFLISLFIFVLGYAIFITNTQVGFSPTGIANRVAIVASAGVALTFISLCGWFFSMFLPKPATKFFFSVSISVLIIGNILVTNYLASYWVHAYDTGQVLLADVAQNIPTMPQNTTLFIDGVCPYVGPAPVFEGNWDIKGALQTKYNDKTLRADIITPRIDLTDKWITATIYTFSEYYPYHNLYIYNDKTKKIFAVTDIEDAKTYFNQYNPDLNNGCPSAQAGEGVKVWQ